MDRVLIGKAEGQAVVEESARGLYFLAGTLAIFGFVQHLAWLDAVLLAAVGLWLRRSRGKAPAIVLVSLGAAKGLLTLRAVLEPNHTGWLGFVGATILVWLGARSLNARRKLDATVSNEKTVEAG